MKMLLKMAEQMTVNKVQQSTQPAKNPKIPGQKEMSESAISPDPMPSMATNQAPNVNPLPSPFANAHKRVVPKVQQPGLKPPQPK